jgi:hypothetical protein
MLKKPKWWQWALIVIFGYGGLSTLVNGPPPRASTKVEPRFSPPDAEFEAIARDTVFAMTFDRRSDPDALPDLAREQCGRRPACQVLGWTDEKFAARAMPMTDREVSELAFSYSLNRGTAFEQTLWDCNRWQRQTPMQCISR